MFFLSVVCFLYQTSLVVTCDSAETAGFPRLSKVGCCAGSIAVLDLGNGFTTQPPNSLALALF